MNSINIRSVTLTLTILLLLCPWVEAKQEKQSNDKPVGAANMSSGPLKGPTVKKPYSDEAIKRYNRGVELHQAGFLNQAIGEYKAAIAADDRMEEAYSNLGGIYAAQRSWNKAIEAFDKALELRPDRSTTLNGYGTVLYARGRTQEAMAKWELAVRADPAFASAYYNMGTALENEKKIPAALGVYSKAIEVNPSMADAYYRIGTIYAKQKHPAQALIVLRRALDLAPDADFSHDARKQVTELNNQFGGEQKQNDKEVQMNVLPPSAGSHQENSAADEKEKPSSTDVSKDNPEKKKLGLFKRSSTHKKKSDTSVLPSDGDSQPGKQDLQDAPADKP